MPEQANSISISGQPGWYRALTLAERTACSSRGALESQIPSAAARDWLAYWRAQEAFVPEGLFGQRLAAASLSEDEFLGILDETAEQLQQRCPVPEWLRELEAGISSPGLQFELLPESLRKSEIARFLEGFEPWLRQARLRLRREIASLGEAPTGLPDPLVLEDLLYHDLPERLVGLISRVMVLELNVFRLKGMLHGETAQERFASFCKQLRDPQVMLELLKEYPVLARMVVHLGDCWLQASLEFLAHFRADHSAIQKTFFAGADPCILAGLRAGIGDPHRGGRTVRRIAFQSGRLLIYKPRSLAVELHFQELLQWVNERLPDFQFRTLQILDCGDHGWVEFVEPQPCATEEKIKRFYERLGAYVALMYALNGVDIHYENLIAAGEHPVIIDLESLFYPGFDDLHGDSRSLAERLFDRSVVRTGLLPQKMWADEGRAGIDLSGAGGTPGQEFPLPVPGWKDSGTDEMRFVREHQALPMGKNRPSLEGNEISILDYQDVLESGFTRMYRFLIAHRQELLSPDGVLARFQHDHLRIILRATQSYGALLTEGTHPHVLRDGLDRDCLFDRLWMDVPRHPWLAGFIRSELEQLNTFDIPVFTTQAGSRDITSGSGETFPNVWLQTPLDGVHDKLMQLSESDLEQQLWFLRASIATVSFRHSDLVKSAYRIHEPAEIMPLAKLNGRLLAKAIAVGDRLEALALRSENDVAWIGLNYSQAGGWELGLAALDVYNGLPGIALFLAYLGGITGEERFTQLARSAITTILARCADKPDLHRQTGLFDGLGGIIYVLSHLYALWDAPELLREAECLVEAAFPLVDRDAEFDLVYGSAGCIAGLLSFYQCAPLACVQDLMCKCGDHLVAQAKVMQQGSAWQGKFPATQPLTGFSHGAAGVSWALMELAHITGKQSYRETAMAGVAYERSVFSRAHKNWPDFRERPPGSGDEMIFESNWCNGAPGIGLGRLAMRQHVQDPEFDREIADAVETTIAAGFGRNHSLCHGDLGNIELLLQARAVLGLENLAPHIDRIVGRSLERIEQHGWLTGILNGVETPGLMVGIAGIGYGLLRLAFSHRVPSVLTMDSPVGVRRSIEWKEPV